MTLRLASPFQDHAVLQRDQTLPVWGWAEPDTRVRVTLAGHEAHALSNAQGDWLVRLPALPAGGPHTLAVESPANGETLTISDLLVGEVWLASGQSNMNWTLNQSRPLTDETIATADFPAIRFFDVARRTHLGPHRTVGGSWKPATPDNAPHFSAVAYSFARRLHRELGVPVGILSASWGGTIIESWTSRATLAHNPDLADRLAAYEATAWTADRWKHGASLGPDGRQPNPALPADPGRTVDWHSADLDDSAWTPINLPATWQSAGEKYSGVFWFRRTVDLPAGWAGRDLELHLGAVDKQDITHVNGVEIGRTGAGVEDRHWNAPRTYRVPAGLAERGTLNIAVRAYSFIYDGGLIGPASAMKLHPVDDPGAAIPLAGGWRFRREHDFGVVVPPAPVPGHGEPNSPHMLFDNMIAPLVPCALRGAIWYQGESNEATAGIYGRLLRDLVQDWRRQWGLPGLAFHVVQLPGFRAPQAHQPDSGWARLREAQAAVLDLPGTGLTTIIDLGEAGDIHPKDKLPVGERLAQSALADTYGRDITARGPLAAGFTVTGDTMRIEFSNTGGGLVTSDGAPPGFLFLAGEDRVFHPAASRIERNALLVASPAVPAPVAARYAWADNPAGCNLANREGLPASPFRTDDW
ncbi:MAG: sialate O-acetylesterase [Verrucomicrobiota bacterium]